MFKRWGILLIGGCLWAVAPAAAETKYAQEADFARALQREFVEQVGRTRRSIGSSLGARSSFAVDGRFSNQNYDFQVQI